VLFRACYRGSGPSHDPGDRGLNCFTLAGHFLGVSGVRRSAEKPVDVDALLGTELADDPCSSVSAEYCQVKRAWVTIPA